MAQPPPPEEEQPSSFFPDPPPFYKHFTTENFNRLKQFKEDRNIIASDDAPLTLSQLLDLPPELRDLRHLVPPEPPAEDEEYRVFQTTTKLRGKDEFEDMLGWMKERLWDEHVNDGILKGWKYEQLYPSPPPDTSSWSSLDRQNYLFRFLRSIILLYVELLGVMAANPTGTTKDDQDEKIKDQKLKDILNLVLNMHALINEYRPHQARETLIGIMEAQVERKKREVEGVRAMREKVRGVLEGFEKEAPVKSLDGEEDGLSQEEVDEQERLRGAQRQMWQAMDEILGH